MNETSIQFLASGLAADFQSEGGNGCHAPCIYLLWNPKRTGRIEGVEGSECIYTVVVVEVRCQRRCSGGVDDGCGCGARKRPTVEEAF